MQKSAHFRVAPKLAHVLGESYTSSEKVLKELVDNAWDAEATEVQVTVPNILTDAPIIVQDNGSGMKTAELEAEYLNIASPRFSRKGDRTPNLNRIVKGRKGIGKFAGLILASEMELVTQAAGKRTRGLITNPPSSESIQSYSCPQRARLFHKRTEKRERERFLITGAISY